MTLTKGDVVLVPFPFTNLQQTKLRPALVLWADSSSQDITLCFISSQNLSNLGVGEFILDSSDPEFTSTGLKVLNSARLSPIPLVFKTERETFDLIRLLNALVFVTHTLKTIFGIILNRFCVMAVSVE